MSNPPKASTADTEPKPAEMGLLGLDMEVAATLPENESAGF